MTAVRTFSPAVRRAPVRASEDAPDGAATSPPADPAPEVSVIIPTYREAENLPFIVPAVSAALRAAGRRFELLVVDDDSRDGSVEAAAALAALHPLRLIVRTDDRDLARAVLHGFRQARGRFLVCMDADGSHPPAALAAMIDLLAAGAADFVLGSRYVPGGSTDERWGRRRRLFSRAANVLLWPLTHAHDAGGGFFALPRARFAAAAPLNPVGYKVALELLVKTGARRVRELPIHFADRRRGQSKFSFRVKVQFLRHLARLWRFHLFHARRYRWEGSRRK